MERLNVGILIFDEVEVLDFAGPFEVFSRTRLEAGVESRRSDASAPFTVFTVAASDRLVRATGGLEAHASAADGGRTRPLASPVILSSTVTRRCEGGA